MMSDERLEFFIDRALDAVVPPEGRAAFIREYRREQAKADMDSARWFYNDKTPLEANCIRDGHGEVTEIREPAWASDQGLGAGRLLDDVDDTLDEARRAIQAALKLVYRKAPHCLPTLRLVLVYGTDRRMSIIALLGFRPATPEKWEVARRKYFRDLDVMIVIFETRNRRNPGQGK